MSQIGFFATETDEQPFAAYISVTGGRFLPSSFPKHPIPILPLPLPCVTEPHMASLCVWFPDVYSEAEFTAHSRTAFNPASGLYTGEVLPVLELLRCRMHDGRWLTGSLRLNASVSSFRFPSPLHTLSAAEMENFSERLRKLQRHYQRLCKWVRGEYRNVGRQQYVGPDWDMRFKQ